ncbi:MAG: DUF6588 family protein [Flavobacteriaceae bacterium]
MKRIVLVSFLFFAGVAMAQSDLEDLLLAGIDDAEQFTTDYLAPATEGIIYGVSGSWYNTAEAKPLGGFEISIIGNMAFFGNKEDKKQFILNTADYENLQFVDGSTSKPVSTALGDIEGVEVFVEDETGLAREEFELPTGLASENIDFIPSGYIQVSVGLIKGTEIKARFLPKIKADELELSFYGFGLQHEFTKHLPADKILPVAISAVIGYTHFDGNYDLSASDIIDGSNQRLEMDINSWLFQAVASTRLPVINFYGGLGYLTGKSKSDALGTYIVESGPIQASYTDPFSIVEDTNGVVGNIGAKLKLGFFRLHADYSFGGFNNLSVGINFGFR